MIEIQNLIYKEDHEARCFMSENFNFIYSKIDNSSCTWGKTKEETPEYNPISPESIIFKINEDFIFDRETIMKLLSIKPENDEFISCINSVILEGENYYNNWEVKRLVKFIEDFNVLCFLKIDFKNIIDLKEIFKIKYLGIKNIILNVENNFNRGEIIESISNLFNNDILVNCIFNIDSKNVNEFVLMLNDNYDCSIFTKIYFNKPMIKKEQLEELTNVIRTKEFLDIVVIKPRNSRKKYEIKNIFDESGLFNCLVDFFNKKIYCSSKNSENFVNINDVKNINDYWNSLEFNNFRKKILKGF